MRATEFVRLARLLTGTESRGHEASMSTLDRALSDESRVLDHSQFNELLLLINKNRVSSAFFHYYFAGLRNRPDGPDGSREAPVSALAQGVDRFRRDAMLVYGNFVFAFRRLSQAKSLAALLEDLGPVARAPAELEQEYRRRPDKLTEINEIAEAETPFVGYLSVKEMVAKKKRVEALLAASDSVAPAADPAEVVRLACLPYPRDSPEQRVLQVTGDLIRSRDSVRTAGELRGVLRELLDGLELEQQRVSAVRAQAAENQDTYLTWDHMDVYFATSMRRRSEYRQVFRFIQSLMVAPRLRELRLRYFDPTQCYSPDRIKKGLVEALMLKRARCTVYLVQEADTLGKDSELAVTLAQGKPVIAYLPDVDVEERAAELQEADLLELHDRLHLLVQADPECADALDDSDTEFFWRSPSELAAVDAERGPVGRARLARILATSEKRLYDSRARTLKEAHPLGVQVNLRTGVANGVLVVRTVADCAEVLARVLTNDLQFDIDDRTDGCHLIERISGCTYRVVTRDERITNCFWSFYLRTEH
jgi:hypothetical protein